MTKIDIVSGFLGAGKTTLIKKMLEMELIYPMKGNGKGKYLFVIRGLQKDILVLRLSLIQRIRK